MKTKHGDRRHFGDGRVKIKMKRRFGGGKGILKIRTTPQLRSNTCDDGSRGT